MVFCFVIKIAEEINAGKRFQFANIGHVDPQLIVTRIIFRIVRILVFMLNPEGKGLVATFVLAKNGHEEILGHDLVADQRTDVLHLPDDDQRGGIDPCAFPDQVAAATGTVGRHGNLIGLVEVERRAVAQGEIIGIV